LDDLPTNDATLFTYKEINKRPHLTTGAKTEMRPLINKLSTLYKEDLQEKKSVKFCDVKCTPRRGHLSQSSRRADKKSKQLGAQVRSISIHRLPGQNKQIKIDTIK